MKKRIISTLMAAMVSLSLLACGSNKAGESETIRKRQNLRLG